MERKSSQPFELFYCYARKDRELRDELNIHLAGLRRSGLITAWYDGEIIPGKPWKLEIEKHLDTAHIILLLISPDFIHSDYCYSEEMEHAIERHHQGKTRVVPILLRPHDWSDTPFSTLQMLPSDAEPVTLWLNRDAAFTDIAKGIRRVVNNLQSLPLVAPDPPLPLPDEQQQREQTISNEELGQASLSATALSEVSPHPPPMQQMVQALAPQISESPPETETQILTQPEEINDSAAHIHIPEREHKSNSSNFGGDMPMKGISRQKEQDIVPATTTNQQSRDVFVRLLCPSCSQPVNVADGLCENCGAVLPVAVSAGQRVPSTSSNTRQCPGCQSALIPDDDVCHNCGAFVPISVASSVSAGQSVPSMSSNTRQCSGCQSALIGHISDGVIDPTFSSR